ncbi:MAG: DUF3576 domain-containing protein [Rhodovibrio sp.]|nr:DUF3576 domain-containing protein [Rhodovibrio sp.]
MNAPYSVVAITLITLLTACGNFSGDGDTVYPDDDYRRTGTSTYDVPDDGILGSGNILGGGSDDAPAGGTGIGVNAYLWRASLDTLSFMPVDSADPFGGVILTDWYSPPKASDERFKVNLYILGRQLRADGLRVSVFRQERGPQGNWRDVEAHGQTATELENAILARAREMRIASAQ